MFGDNYCLLEDMTNFFWSASISQLDVVGPTKIKIRSKDKVCIKNRKFFSARELVHDHAFSFKATVLLEY